MTTSTTATSPHAAPDRRPIVRLGEELPIFCEKCGYSLEGLPQIRCEHCAILQFACPECGHHQPINTLRPAAQRIIGRLRAAWLVWVVFFKLNFFGWLLFAWFAMGVEWSFKYMASTSHEQEMVFGFAIFAVPFAIVSRMLLLRWRRSSAVGIMVASVVLLAVLVGRCFRSSMETQRMQYANYQVTASDLFPFVLIGTFGVIVLASMCAWPIWVMLVRTFLPKQLGTSLLEWQKSQSNRTTSAITRA